MNVLKDKRQIEEFMHLDLFPNGAWYGPLIEYLKKFGTEGIAWDDAVYGFQEDIPVYGIRYNPNIAGHINHDSDNYGRKYNGLQLRVDRRRAEKTIWMDLFDDDEGMYSAIKELILAVQHSYDFVLWCILEEEKKNIRRKIRNY